MKRMHLHIAVADLAQSIIFYNRVFGSPPTVTKNDYAKWLLDDPSVNFAISTRSNKLGLDHIGIQAENDAELMEIKTRLDNAEMHIVSQAETTCCYSQSDKHWIQDPSGIAWETYHTLASAPTFNGQSKETIDTQASACCAPTPQPIALMPKSKNKCA